MSGNGKDNETTLGEVMDFAAFKIPTPDDLVVMQKIKPPDGKRSPLGLARQGGVYSCPVGDAARLCADGEFEPVNKYEAGKLAKAAEADKPAKITDAGSSAPNES